MSLSSFGIYTARVIRPMTDAPISVGPLIVPEPTIGANPATKDYADAHSGGGDVPQQQIIYLSTAGNDATADGLTLNTAFGTLTAAATAANAVASASNRVVISCADAGIFVFTETVTLDHYVDLYAPNATIFCNTRDMLLRASLDNNLCAASFNCRVAVNYGAEQATGEEMGSIKTGFCLYLVFSYTQTGEPMVLNSRYVATISNIGELYVEAQGWPITVNTRIITDTCVISNGSIVYLNARMFDVAASVIDSSVLYLSSDVNDASNVTTEDSTSVVHMRSSLATALGGPGIYNDVPYTPGSFGHPYIVAYYSNVPDICGPISDYEIYRRGSQVYLTMGAQKFSITTTSGEADIIGYYPLPEGVFFNDLLVPNIDCTAYTPLTVTHGSTTYNTYGTFQILKDGRLRLSENNGSAFDFTSDTGYVQVPAVHISFPGTFNTVQ